MGLTPISFLIFMLIFIAAAIAMAAAVWHVHENGRYAGLIRAVAFSAVVVLFAFVALTAWNDIGGATSVVHHRLFLAAFVIAMLLALVSYLAGRNSQGRRQELFVAFGMLAAGCMIGIAVGTTDWSGAAAADDYVRRAMLTVYAVFALVAATAKRTVPAQGTISQRHYLEPAAHSK